MFHSLPAASSIPSLTGKYSDDSRPDGTRFAGNMHVLDYLRERQFSEARIARVRQFDDCARECGRTILDPAMSWLARQPAVASVIAGATRLDQITNNVAAASWAVRRRHASLAEMRAEPPAI